MHLNRMLPCDNCPYRKDAPLRHWHKEEFVNLLANDCLKEGDMYECHKEDGNVCIGWMYDQLRRELPNIQLRVFLMKQLPFLNKKIDSLIKAMVISDNIYISIEDMINANYPEILTEWKEIAKNLTTPYKRPYRIAENEQGDMFIECINCSSISYNTNDIREKYCGKCHQFLDYKINY